jgi:hypothetical protein
MRWADPLARPLASAPKTSANLKNQGPATGVGSKLFAPGLFADGVFAPDGEH